MRGSLEETLTLAAFFARCEVYFESGKIIDQLYQSQLPLQHQLV